MNEMFTEAARKAIELARDEAIRFGHDYIGCEHLLLGLIRHGKGRATEILANLGLEPQYLRRTVEEVIQPPTGGEQPEQLPLTGRAKTALETSGTEARALKTKEIDTEHLLLALAKDERNVACQVLSMHELSYNDVYQELLLIQSGRPSKRQAKRIRSAGRNVSDASTIESKTLSIIVDDSVSSDQMGQFLAELNRLYTELCGDQLVIREGRVPLPQFEVTKS